MSHRGGWLTGWRVPLLIARREAGRARGRSLLVLVMIALPVLAVTATDVVLHTQDVGATESLDRRLGAAQAAVTVQKGVTTVEQAPDPNQGMASGSGSASVVEPPLTAGEVARRLGGARLVERRTSSFRVRSDSGIAQAEGLEVDLTDPLAQPLFALRSGRLPRSIGEVVVNRALASKGYAVGDRLELPDDPDVHPRVVGIAESTTVRSLPYALGPVGSLPLADGDTTTWLVGGDPVSWSQVRDLNASGATVVSRAVLLDPPPPSQVPAEVRPSSGGPSETSLAVAALVVVMALIEVVLLAGPAFAVGARRQSRSLALLAATGGTPRQARRVVLAGALVLGSVASLTAAALGIGVAWLALPLVQRLDASWFGPFEVPWLQLLGVIAFGLLSALLAAVVPARTASRQDVVAVLAGRRGDRPPSVRSPLLGGLLLGVGVAGAVAGARGSGQGELLIAASAVLSVLGMVLLVPVVVSTLARLSGRLPLVLRYAVRDADRHRTRTVPAVAAVAATVAGVVALGIANASDSRENQATYRPTLARGVGVLTDHSPSPDWPALSALVRRTAPSAEVTPVRGVRTSFADGSSLTVQLSVPGSEEPLLESYGSAFGSELLVSDGGLPPGLLGLSSVDRRQVEAALRSGSVVALSAEGPTRARRVAVTVTRYGATGDGTDRHSTVRALVVEVSSADAGPQALLPPAAARRLHLPVAEVGLALTGPVLTGAQQTAIEEGAAALSPSAGLVVERGFRPDDATRVIQLVLMALGAVLMLGGTLTATFLALSDARPDLATLAAVGAAPRTRRGVAAAYAVVVGLVGAVLGAAVGFVPGIAIAYPLTRRIGQGGPGGGPTGPFVDIPWLMVLGLVVLLPLLTAAVVGLAARSRLPLTARLD